MSRVVVVMPGRNNEATLVDTVNDLPTSGIDEIILVDNASVDRTADLAAELGLTVIRHEMDRGYGGSQKSGYAAALEGGADYVIMVHPDFQYDARMVPAMVKILEVNTCDIVLGNRIRSRREALAGRMPVWKYLLNRSSTLVENSLLGQNLGEFHSGLRAYSRNALERLNFPTFTNDYAFDQELLIAAAHLKMRIGDVPVPVRYFEEATSIKVRPSLRYGWDSVKAMVCLFLHKSRLRRDVRWLAR